MKRPLIYLGGVIAIAVIVFLIERPDLLKRGDVGGEPVYPQYDARKIERIEIRQLMSGVQIKKEGDGWFVADLITSMREELMEKEGVSISEPKWFPADRVMVGGALGVFGQFPRGVVVSNNPEMQGVYNVADKIGLNVRLYDSEGNKMVDVLIGKRSPDMTSDYIRLEGSDEVMLSDRIIDDMFPAAVAKWRDKAIWRIDPKKVQALEVWQPKDTYHMVKEDGKWTLVEPENTSLDGDKIKDLIGHLSAMHAVGFASMNDPKINFKNPSMKFKLQTMEGDIFELELGGSNNLNQYYARRSGTDEVYLVANLKTVIPSDWKDLK